MCVSKDVEQNYTVCPMFCRHAKTKSLGGKEKKMDLTQDMDKSILRNDVKQKTNEIHQKESRTRTRSFDW